LVRKGKNSGKRADKRRNVSITGWLWPAQVIFCLAVLVRGFCLYKKTRDDNIYCNFGICLKQRGRIDEAIEAFNKALATNPQNKKVSKALGGMQR